MPQAGWRALAARELSEGYDVLVADQSPSPAGGPSLATGDAAYFHLCRGDLTGGLALLAEAPETCRREAVASLASAVVNPPADYESLSSLYDLGSNGCLVLTVGRLAPEKNHWSVVPASRPGTPRPSSINSGSRT